MSSRQTNFTKTLQFLIVPQISSLIPHQQIERNLLQIPRNIPLADPEFHKPAPIHILLGTSASFSILSVGQIRLNTAFDIYLQKTLLGWIVGGNMSEAAFSDTITCMHATIIDEFKRFWEIEDVGSVDKHLSAMEIKCEEHFAKHVTRNAEGRYVVALPFNNLRDRIGFSRIAAKRRFHTLEQKFRWNPDLEREYSAIMEEYIELRHMIQVNDDSDIGFYLPHHAVFKEGSLTTKVRVVFDASAKSSTKVSLNDALMVGPTIQDNILSIVLRFRRHRYVFTGDIEKMYRQILVRPEDTKFQRILWRKNDTVRTYELQTVTFGVASAPYLATRCLQQVADDEGTRFPLGARILRRDLYVDDVLSGADSLEETLQIRDQLIGILKTAGFNLRQCASNSMGILQGLPDCAINTQLLSGDDQSLKTLGLHWNSKRDIIFYTVNPIATRDTVTMRTIASDIARIFDPLGLLNPVISHAKIIQQELWRLRLNWDDTTPLEIHTRWNEFAQQLTLLNNIEFERKIIRDNAASVELHGFCDASERAYGACVYIRSTDTHGETSSNLLIAKSRITPLKGSHTIPRLELCAAELLSSLYVTATQALDVKLHRVILWSDSTIVLHWLRTSPHLLQRFVANRVAKIQEKTDVQSWRHVRTHDNPADAISRGQLPREFLSNDLWLNGPKWLIREENDWPVSVMPEFKDLPELKITTCLHAVEHDLTIFSRISSFKHLQRIIAWCLRWRFRSETALLSLGELERARVRVIKVIQRQHFADDIEKLENGHTTTPKSRLNNLSPFLDRGGLLRVGGRLQKSSLPFDSRHPALLPKTNHVTSLIIRETHEEMLHAGVQATLCAIRQKYWIVDGRNQIRHIIRRCVTCARHKPTIVEYKMSNLPPERITQMKPFTHTGIDYCGPFFIKERKHRNRQKLKAWICIFVCLTIKAVHIEVVTDLSSEEFLATLSRFISRHPSCQTLHSDNATTFTGANNELRELYKFLRGQSNAEFIQRNLQKQGIEWNFIPPSSPHCGGIWEAAVKSCKRHLKRVMGNELFTYEQLNTLCIKIEAVLNSRPLTALSSDPNDLEALTSAHFLHGDINRDVPAPNWTDTPVNHLSCWQHLEQIKQHFWNRWYKEYLNELNVRKKWTNGGHDITVGSLVLIRDDNLPPLRWRLGRVIETFPGSDGIIRKVKLRTNHGITERNVRRVAPLPVEIPRADTS